jgi:hypothetical protein
VDLGEADQSPDLGARLLSSQADFDPATETREFTLISSDYGAAVFGVALAKTLHDEAPGVRLTFRQTSPTLLDNAGASVHTQDAGHIWLREVVARVGGAIA